MGDTTFIIANVFLENDKEIQVLIGQEAKVKLEIRENMKEKDGLASSLTPTAPNGLDLYC